MPSADGWGPTHVKRVATLPDVEGALVDWIDAGGSGLKRTPTCPQTLIVEAAIREKRITTKQYAGRPRFARLYLEVEHDDEV